MLFIWMGGSPFSTSHTYTPSSFTVTLSIVRVLLENSSQLFLIVGTKFVIKILELLIWMKKVRSVNSVPFLFSHMILGAGNPVASQVIVTVADSFTVTAPLLNFGKLGGTVGKEQ